MLKNKKSLLVMTALIRIIIALAVLFVIIIPACNTIRSLFTDEKKYSESFENFVNGINEMEGPDSTRQFLLELNKESAIIGFSKNADSYKCHNCFPGREETTVSKPPNPECNDGNKACICLCNGKFKLEDEGTIIRKEVGKCQEEYVCKTLDYDITAKTIIKERWGDDIYWTDGFLFARDIEHANGIEKNTKETTTLYVEKRRNYGPLQPGEPEYSIGVCNLDMLGYNEKTFKMENEICINYDKEKK